MTKFSYGVDGLEEERELRQRKMAEYRLQIMERKAKDKLDQEEVLRLARIERFGEVTDDSQIFILYRHFNSESLLIYVGITSDPAKRLRAHQSRSQWWAEVADGGYTTYETFDSREELILAEKDAIASERPRDNIQRL